MLKLPVHLTQPVQRRRYGGDFGGGALKVQGECPRQRLGVIEQLEGGGQEAEQAPVSLPASVAPGLRCRIRRSDSSGGRHCSSSNCMGDAAGFYMASRLRRSPQHLDSLLFLFMLGYFLHHHRSRVSRYAPKP